MLTDEMLAGVCFQAIVEDQSLLRVLIAQAREANALRARCEDLELMLRCAMYGIVSSWISHERDGSHVAVFGREVGSDGHEHRYLLADDGTGLPVLTDEARAALRKAVGR